MPSLHDPDIDAAPSPRRISEEFYYEIYTPEPTGCSADGLSDKFLLSTELLQELAWSKRELAPDLPCSLARGLPDQLFVYCDICEPYVTGDVHSPLLRVVSLRHTSGEYSFGCNTEKYFAPPNYIPLRATCFRTVEIDIRDQTGKRIPFEFGTLTVTLHFRRCD